MVSAAAIPRYSSMLALPSTDSGPYPKFSPLLPAPRRAPPPAAASARRDASSPPFPSIQAAGEAHRLPLFLVRAPFRPPLASPAASPAGRRAVLSRAIALRLCSPELEVEEEDAAAAPTMSSSAATSRSCSPKVEEEEDAAAACRHLRGRRRTG